MITKHFIVTEWNVQVKKWITSAFRIFEDAAAKVLLLGADVGVRERELAVLCFAAETDRNGVLLVVIGAELSSCMMSPRISSSLILASFCTDDKSDQWLSAPYL